MNYNMLFNPQKSLRAAEHRMLLYLKLQRIYRKTLRLLRCLLPVKQKLSMR